MVSSLSKVSLLLSVLFFVGIVTVVDMQMVMGQVQPLQIVSWESINNLDRVTPTGINVAIGSWVQLDTAGDCHSFDFISFSETAAKDSETQYKNMDFLRFINQPNVQQMGTTSISLRYQSPINQIAFPTGQNPLHVSVVKCSNDLSPNPSHPPVHQTRSQVRTVIPTQPNITITKIQLLNLSNGQALETITNLGQSPIKFISPPAGSYIWDLTLNNMGNAASASTKWGVSLQQSTPTLTDAGPMQPGQEITHRNSPVDSNLQPTLFKVEYTLSDGTPYSYSINSEFRNRPMKNCNQDSDCRYYFDYANPAGCYAGPTIPPEFNQQPSTGGCRCNAAKMCELYVAPKATPTVLSCNVTGPERVVYTDNARFEVICFDNGQTKPCSQYPAIQFDPWGAPTQTNQIPGSSVMEISNFGSGAWMMVGAQIQNTTTPIRCTPKWFFSLNKPSAPGINYPWVATQGGGRLYQFENLDSLRYPEGWSNDARYPALPWISSINSDHPSVGLRMDSACGGTEQSPAGSWNTDWDVPADPKINYAAIDSGSRCNIALQMKLPSETTYTTVTPADKIQVPGGRQATIDVVPTAFAGKRVNARFAFWGCQNVITGQSCGAYPAVDDICVRPGSATCTPDPTAPRPTPDVKCMVEGPGIITSSEGATIWDATYNYDIKCTLDGIPGQSCLPYTPVVWRDTTGNGIIRGPTAGATSIELASPRENMNLSATIKVGTSTVQCAPKPIVTIPELRGPWPKDNTEGAITNSGGRVWKFPSGQSFMPLLGWAGNVSGYPASINSLSKMGFRGYCGGSSASPMAWWETTYQIPADHTILSYTGANTGGVDSAKLEVQMRLPSQDTFTSISPADKKIIPTTNTIELTIPSTFVGQKAIIRFVAYGGVPSTPPIIQCPWSFYLSEICMRAATGTCTPNGTAPPSNPPNATSPAIEFLSVTPKKAASNDQVWVECAMKTAFASALEIQTKIKAYTMTNDGADIRACDDAPISAGLSNPAFKCLVSTDAVYSTARKYVCEDRANPANKKEYSADPCAAIAAGGTCPQATTSSGGGGGGGTGGSNATGGGGGGTGGGGGGGQPTCSSGAYTLAGDLIVTGRIRAQSIDAPNIVSTAGIAPTSSGRCTKIGPTISQAGSQIVAAPTCVNDGLCEFIATISSPTSMSMSSMKFKKSVSDVWVSMGQEMAIPADVTISPDLQRARTGKIGANGSERILNVKNMGSCSINDDASGDRAKIELLASGLAGESCEFFACSLT